MGLVVNPKKKYFVNEAQMKKYVHYMPHEDNFYMQCTCAGRFRTEVANILELKGILLFLLSLKQKRPGIHLRYSLLLPALKCRAAICIPLCFHQGILCATERR